MTRVPCISILSSADKVTIDSPDSHHEGPQFNSFSPRRVGFYEEGKKVSPTSTPLAQRKLLKSVHHFDEFIGSVLIQLPRQKRHCITLYYEVCKALERGGLSKEAVIEELEQVYYFRNIQCRGKEEKLANLAWIIFLLKEVNHHSCKNFIGLVLSQLPGNNTHRNSFVHSICKAAQIGEFDHGEVICGLLNTYYSKGAPIRGKEERLTLEKIILRLKKAGASVSGAIAKVKIGREWGREWAQRIANRQVTIENFCFATELASFGLVDQLSKAFSQALRKEIQDFTNESLRREKEDNIAEFFAKSMAEINHLREHPIDDERVERIAQSIGLLDDPLVKGHAYVWIAEKISLSNLMRFQYLQEALVCYQQVLEDATIKAEERDVLRAKIPYVIEKILSSWLLLASEEPRLKELLFTMVFLMDENSLRELLRQASRPFFINWLSPTKKEKIRFIEQMLQTLKRQKK